MANYRFEDQWGDLVIISPTVNWIFAGFDIRGNGILTLTIELVTDSTTYQVTLTTAGKANDRSDEAIELLMNQLLEPHIVTET